MSKRANKTHQRVVDRFSNPAVQFPCGKDSHLLPGASVWYFPGVASDAAHFTTPAEEAQASVQHGAPARRERQAHLHTFDEWKYDGTTRQRLDRAHGERIANELNARVAKGDPGIPVYQGHPDVRALAAKYPDKGALGWVERIELANEGGRDGLALTVAWDRDPGRGFRWFSPYWLAGREGSTYVVDNIASIGLVNNPNIPEFRLANEAEDNNQKKGTIMDREKLIQKLGLPPEATDDQIWEAFDKMKADADAKAAADAKAEAAKTAETAAATDAEAARRETDDAKRALDNERKLRADDAVSAAVRERRIGEGARLHLP